MLKKYKNNHLRVYNLWFDSNTFKMNFVIRFQFHTQFVINSSIFDDIALAKECNIDDEEIDIVCSCLEMSRDALTVSAELLPSCLLGRLQQKNNKDHPAIRRLLQRAVRPGFDCLYSSQGRYSANIDKLLQWHHNERDGVSNHRRLDCLFSRLFRRRSKKTSKFRIPGLWKGNPPVTGRFPS